MHILGGVNDKNLKLKEDKKKIIIITVKEIKYGKNKERMRVWHEEKKLCKKKKSVTKKCEVMGAVYTCWVS